MSRLLFLIVFTLSAVKAFSQKHTQEFHLPQPDKKVSGSLYNSIQLLDLREDTTNLGIVHTGGFNCPERLVPNPSLRSQVHTLLSQLLDSTTAQPGELLLRLQQFRFSEFTNSHPKVGYCQLGAELLVKTGTGYQLLNTLDTTLKIAQKSDVTAEILQAGIACFTAFLSESLIRSAGGKLYSHEDVIHLDSLRKRELFVYNTLEYTNGLYRSYDAFVAQKPDAQISAELKNGYLRRVWKLDENGKKGELLNKKSIYGVVFEGQPYVANEFGCYLLKKQNNDFVYNGMVRVDADAVLASMAYMYGAAGVLLSKALSGTTTDWYKIKVDYRNGKPVLLRKYEF
jgi:hypothetical protein